VHDAVLAKGAHGEDDLLLVIHYEQYRLLLFHARRPVVLFLPARSYPAAFRLYRKRSPPAYAGGASPLYDPPRALAVQVRRVSVVVVVVVGWLVGWLAYRLTGVLLHLLLGRPHPRVFGVLGLALIFQPAFGVDCRPTAVPGGGNGLPVALV
jgi:hypothetical protein